MFKHLILATLVALTACQYQGDYSTDFDFDALAASNNLSGAEIAALLGNAQIGNSSGDWNASASFNMYDSQSQQNAQNQSNNQNSGSQV